jgi:hypothetical protein
VNVRSVAIGAAGVIGLIWLYRRATAGKLVSADLATGINLNPALYRYPGSSSITGGPR